jgi:L-threonylcarbamoyladenylate synthase
VSPELAARVAEVARLLRQGGVVAYPTETFYGLGALVTHPEALRRLAGAKLRPGGQPLPLIAGDLAQVEGVASLSAPLARALAGRFWPGALTLVLPAAPGLDPLVRGGDGTVAIRIPGSEVARALALAAGAPLVSTSANLAGEPPPAAAGELSPILRSRLDAVLDAGPTPGGTPSTIVAVAGDTARLLRAGAVPWSQVEAAAAR